MISKISIIIEWLRVFLAVIKTIYHFIYVSNIYIVRKFLFIRRSMLYDIFIYFTFIKNLEHKLVIVSPVS